MSDRAKLPYIRFITIKRDRERSDMDSTQDRPCGADDPILGRCPICGAQIPPAGLLASYSVEEEWPRMLAECGRCAEIVGPQ